MVDRDLLKPHDYDGIQEYDNDLPRWWLALLWITVIWAVVYVFHFHCTNAQLGPALLKTELARIDEERARTATGPLSEELLRSLSHNQERIAHGAAVFAGGQCVTCHGPKADGLINGIPGPCPNLTDSWWLNGSDMTKIVDVISNGRLERGMPVWKGQLSADEITDLACFIANAARNGGGGGKPHDPQRDQQQAIGY
jgi:cytochrome c oxidase cbb3-type subunit III